MAELVTDRETAVLVPVPEAERVVSPHRSRLDGAAALGVPAHVTVLFPFVPPSEITPSVVDALAAAVARVGAFGCEFRATSWFGEDVLYLAPRPDEPFRALTRASGGAVGAEAVDDGHGLVPQVHVHHGVPGVVVADHAQRAERADQGGRGAQARSHPGRLEHDVGTLVRLAVERLTRLVNDEPTVENWAPRAPAVFAAAEDGSGLAMAVIEAAAAGLAGLVRRLRARGAAGTAVVAGGSVVTRQPLLARALEAQLRLVDAELELRVLADEPVAGAVVLARRLLGSRLTQ